MLKATCITIMALLAGAATAQELSPRQEEAVRELFNSFAEEENGISLLSRVVKHEAVRRGAAVIMADDSLPEFGDGITVVEFSDYQCGYCRRMFPILQAENVRVKMVEFPVLGELSVLAARYALSAHKQNRYAEFHVSLMDQQGRLDESILKQTAEKLSLNMQQLQEDLYSEDIERALKKNFQYASLFDVNGTPFFIVNGQPVRGAVDADTLRELLASPAGG